jgi:hypothetical protein
MPNIAFELRTAAKNVSTRREDFPLQFFLDIPLNIGAITMQLPPGES